MKTYPKILIFVAVLSIIIQTIYIYHITTKNLFLPDDAYYYFSLGYNVATGNGPKIDSFNNTTGFQPLWGGICALVFTLVNNKDIAPIILLVISLFVELLAMWLFYKWLIDLNVHPTAVLLATCWSLLSPQIILNQLNGMETSLAVLTVVAVYYSLKFKNPWLTGILFGVALLARVDALIFGIAFSLVCIFYIYFKPTKIKSVITTSTWWSYKTILILWFCAVVVSLPWLLFTLTLQKGLLPESGQAVRLISLLGGELPYYDMGESVWYAPNFHLQQFVNFLSYWNWNITALLPLNLLFVLAPILVSITFILVALGYKHIPTVNIFILHIFGLIVAYSLFIGGEWFYFRYTTTISILFSGLVVGLFYEYVQQRLIRIIYISVVSATIFALHITMINNLTYPLKANNSERGFYGSVLWMNDNIPSTTSVGMFQSGLMGYYATFSVFNLDGKVNHNAYLAMKNKTMWQYICSQKIEYIADWPVLIELLLIKRSSTWQDDNLTLLKEINGVSTYAINLENCLSTNP